MLKSFLLRRLTDDAPSWMHAFKQGDILYVYCENYLKQNVDCIR